MLRYMKENKKLFIGYLLLVPIASISSAAFSMCLEPLINVVYTRSAADFVKYAALMIVFSFLDMGTHYCHKICREKLRVYYVAGMKRDLFNSLLKRSITAFNASPTATYISTINQDVAKMNVCHFDSICGFYRVSVNFLVSLVLVIYMNPMVAVLNIATSSVSLVIPKMFEKKLARKQEISSENSERYYGLLNDYLKGFSTIKLFHIQSIIKERMEHANRKLEHSNCDSVSANYTAGWVSMLCSQLSFVLTTILGVYFALKGYMTVGGVVAVSQLIGGIVVPFEELPMHLANYKSVKSIREKIKRILDVEEVQEEQHAIAVENCDITLEGVSFSYDENTSLIEDVSLTLEEGKKYILVGGSGSGKSTLAKLLMGFYSCDKGKVLLDGRNILEYPESQFYHQMTYLEQSIFLFDDTLLHNITLYSEYTPEEVQRAVRLAGLEELVSELPDGLHTMIQENGQNFSGGEKQRIGIARALLAGARFLILDEVTASLDPVLASNIEQMIMENEHMGVLLITHKWSEELLRKSDKIFVMNKGKLVEQGSFDELMDLKQYFYSYYYQVQ